MAVGANQNLAVVWDVSSPASPVEVCKLPHTSAVKGILFCPWSPHLLATGGGSNDRRVRFWHTASGTLVSVTNTGRQVTGIAWSTTRKEVVVSFGFLAHAQCILVAVYSYPQMELLRSAAAKEAVRALSTSTAPDESRIAVAVNDGTVRIYELWPVRPHSLAQAPSAQGTGSYGSSVIEAAEGIDVRAAPLR